MFELFNPNSRKNLFDRFEEFDNLINWETPKILKVNQKEGEKNYILEVATPGFKKEEISVDYSDEHLKITAEKKKEEKENEKTLYQEHFWTKNTRTIRVGKINPENVETTYQDGILTLRFPKEEVNVSKKIPIK